MAQTMTTGSSTATIHRANSTNALVQVVPRVSQRIMAPTSMPSTCMPEAVSPLGTGKRRKISIMASDMINHSQLQSLFFIALFLSMFFGALWKMSYSPQSLLRCSKLESIASWSRESSALSRWENLRCVFVNSVTGWGEGIF